ncbi:MAG TPA: beta-ketoacyl-[acyl-carrier-protein] synthase family protein [Gaiellaceae bacterium]|nr:beta-ketoacyl-[acyl-carrier-protein] synthase family protein [Gaiellaceae bacterium]
MITGLGAVSPVGADVESLWDALLAGTTGVAAVQSFDATAFDVRIGCEVRDLELASAREPRPGRAALLAAAAGRQALAQAGLAIERRGDVALALGTTMGESCWLEAWTTADVVAGTVAAEELVRSGPDQVGRDVAAELGLGGRVTVLAGACAAGNYALGHALDLVRLGRADTVLAGGTDAFSRVAFTGFARLGALAPDACRPFSADRSGLVLGEGAAFLVVESATAAAARGAAVLAELVGIGLSGDAFHIVSPDPQGRGAARAMAAALEDARIPPGDVDYLSAHGTGTPANDLAEVAAARSVFGDEGPPMSSIKALTGHGLGASSALEAVACVRALQEQVAPPTWNFTRPDPACVWDVIPNEPRERELGVVVSNAYAFGGANASVVLRAA